MAALSATNAPHLTETNFARSATNARSRDADRNMVMVAGTVPALTVPSGVGTTAYGVFLTPVRRWRRWLMDAITFESELAKLLISGDFDEAARRTLYARRSAEADGDRALLERALSAAARVVVASGDFESAARAYAEWLEVFPDSLEAKLQASIFDLYHKRPAVAAGRLAKITLPQRPTDDVIDAGLAASALNIRGLAELATGETMAAVQTMEELLGLMIDWADEDLWFELGLAEALAARHVADDLCRRFVALAAKKSLDAETRERLSQVERALGFDER